MHSVRKAAVLIACTFMYNDITPYAELLVGVLLDKVAIPIQAEMR